MHYPWTSCCGTSTFLLPRNPGESERVTLARWVVIHLTHEDQVMKPRHIIGPVTNTNTLLTVSENRRRIVASGDTHFPLILYIIIWLFSIMWATSANEHPRKSFLVVGRPQFADWLRWKSHNAWKEQTCFTLSVANLCWAGVIVLLAEANSSRCFFRCSSCHAKYQVEVLGYLDQ